jgi:hypothetical protein
MTPIAALAEQLRQCREALKELNRVVPHASYCTARDTQIQADCNCGVTTAKERTLAALTTAPPTAEQIATWERQRETGELVERMPEGSAIAHSQDRPEYELWLFMDPSVTVGSEYAPTAIAALRAALGGET